MMFLVRVMKVASWNTTEKKITASISRRLVS